MTATVAEPVGVVEHVEEIELKDMTASVASPVSPQPDKIGLSVNKNLASGGTGTLNENLANYAGQIKAFFQNRESIALPITLPGKNGGNVWGGRNVRQMIIVRPWLGEFLGGFEKPKAFEVGKILKTLTYFAGNYLGVCALILVIGLLTNTYSLLLVVFLSIVWAYFYQKNDPEWVTVVAGKEITAKHRTIALCVVSFVLTIVFAGNLIFALIGLSALLSIIHAIAHVPKRDYSQIMEEEDSIPAAEGVEGP